MNKFCKIALVAIIFCLGLTAAAQTRVACVGNSITFGTGLNDPKTESYPALLQKMLGDKYLVGNFGKPSATLLEKGHKPYVQQEEYSAAIDFGGDIIVIHLGINDTDPRNWPDYRDNFVRDYLHLIDTLKTKNPSARVLIARLTPLSDRHHRFLSGTRDWHEQIQQILPTIARLSGAQLFDFHTPLYARTELFPDAVHPNARGHQIMAQTVYSAITGDYGGLKMPAVYSDNMVLQRNQSLIIRGTANAGEQVSLSIANQKHRATADSNGKWEIKLSPLSTATNLTLQISAPSRTLTYKNVAAGEVWLCSGQSNMEFMLKQTVDASAFIPQARDGDLRLLDFKARWRTDAVEWPKTALDSINELLHFTEPSWTMASPESAAEFSAIGYHFGRILRGALGSDVPIGMICNAVGGSTAEAWIDRRTLEFEMPALLANYLKNDFIQYWCRGRAALNIKQGDNPLQRHPYQPCYLFESGILPLEHFAIKGVLWYQGESNAHNIEAHEQIFPLLVKSWRKYFENPDLPFYFVQLSSINRPSWPHFRDSQRLLAEKLPNTYMAVSSDKGDPSDVHPRDKRPIGDRLARLALRYSYNFTDIIAHGPSPRCAKFTADTVFLTMDYAQGLQTSDNEAIRTFELAADEGLFVAAEAKIISDNCLAVVAKNLKNPRYLRYGWQPYTRANLCNGEGLPASTFQIDYKQKSPISMTKWTSLPDLVGMEGTPSLGVSAPFAGIIDNYLLVAGGCNFPDKPVTEGGAKRYYSEILALDLASAAPQWKSVGKLPQAVAYGGSAQTPNGLVFVGGNNAEKSFSAAYFVRLENGSPVIENLPSLPFTMDNLAACYADGYVYAAGGNANGKASRAFVRLRIEPTVATQWEQLPELPSIARVQPTLAAQSTPKGTMIFLAGGFQEGTLDAAPIIPNDLLAFNPEAKTWTAVSSLPNLKDGSPRSLTGGTAVSLGKDFVLFFGGVNYNCFMAAVDRPRQMQLAKSQKDKARLKELEQEKAQYMHHAPEWYQFNDEILLFDAGRNEWQVLPPTAETARAGAAAAVYGNRLITIGGELKPGIRTPKTFSVEVER